MTLVNRVSFFFLIALAVVLLVFSAVLYGLVHYALWNQFEAESTAALRTIVAAAEVEPDGVKWQPSDHTIHFGADKARDELRWTVVDESGRVVDHSRDLPPSEALDLVEAEVSESVTRVTGDWEILRQRVSAPMPKPRADRDPDEFAALTVIVARSPAGVRVNLQSLAILLCVMTTVTWIVAAALGRQYCRRALEPVSQMSTNAATIGTADFRSRLSMPPHDDELAGLARAFNDLLDPLQEAFERQRRFTGDAAHQLRTPLSVLLGQIDVALRRPRSSEEYVQTLTLLRRQTEELVELVEVLLFLTRADDDPSLMTHSRPGRLETWLAEQETGWRAHPRGVDLELDIQPLELTTSWAMLAQILNNLIDNAFKYSPPGTPVRVGASRTEKSIVITVEDHGEGVPESERTAIFEPFYRSPQARLSGAAGTGLGLPIARRLAQKLGGRLIHEPLPVRGSRFRLELGT